MPRYSSRVPDQYELNAFSRRLQELKRSDQTILDLTETNPTRVSLPLPDRDHWQALLTGATDPYQPVASGSRRAREAIAATYETSGESISPERIFLTASTSEAYTHLFRLFANPGEGFLVPTPSYPLFPALADLESVALTPYRLRFEGSRWRVDLQALADGIGARTRGIIVVHPNNPTGSFLDEDEAREIRALAARHDLVVISDEVFGESRLIPGLQPQTFAGDGEVLTVVLGGLSKSCALPQAKLAWMVLSGPETALRELTPRLEWIGDTMLSVSPMIQAAAPALLQQRTRTQEAITGRIRNNLDVLDSELSSCATLDRFPVEGGWSVILRHLGNQDEDGWIQQLLSQRVVVHPGYFYEIEETPSIVLSLLPVEEVFQKAIKALCGVGA